MYIVTIIIYMYAQSPHVYMMFILYDTRGYRCKLNSVWLNSNRKILHFHFNIMKLFFTPSGWELKTRQFDKRKKYITF